MRSIETGERATGEAIRPRREPSTAKSTELPPRSIGLQAESEGASAATSSTQDATATTAIDITAKIAPRTIKSLPPIPPRRRCRRRLRCVIPPEGTSPRPGPGPSGDGVFGRVVVDDPFDQELVGDHHRATVAGVDVGVGERDVGDPPLGLLEA